MKTASILLVDDEEFITDSLSRVLQMHGYRCETADSAESAREKLRGDLFDLILCDIQMPGESGLDLLRQVAAELPHTATVMVTGVDDTEVAEQALELGAYGYVIKPFSANEILINVMNALRRSELEARHRLESHELESKLIERESALRQALSQLDGRNPEKGLPWKETVDRLSKALALRDEETARHIERVGLYAELLAEKVGELPWPAAAIKHAAMLHDAGKIGIPDSILLKRGGLTDNERKTLERHTELGYQLLQEWDAPLLDMAANIAFTHHEHWDGAGYPRRLRGGEIPIEGRITAIADTFDMLTTARANRPAHHVDEVLSMLEDAKGRHFDPALIDLMIEARDELLQIREEHPDDVLDTSDLIRVLLVEDQDLLADSMMRLLDGTEGIEVLGRARSVEDGSHLAEKKNPDVVLTDWNLEDGTAQEMIQKIRKTNPDAKVVVLTGMPDEAVLAAAVQAGCSAVLNKNRPFEDIVDSIRAARAGEVTIPLARLQSVLARLSPEESTSRELTEKESEVLTLLAQGFSDEAIAERLALSLDTVRENVQNILVKTGTNTKMDAVATAISEGLLEPRRASFN